jgi:TatD DNase family protein
MLFDAHNHLQDERLRGCLEQVLGVLPRMGVREAVVNGSAEDDWDAVAELARDHAWLRPAFGLHPWYVRQRTDAWKEKLNHLLGRFPGAVVGEIGLDRWIENPDIDAQVECFRWQLGLAARLDRPATIHCLRAWGLLDEVLRSEKLPRRGFLLHSYGGPAEMVAGFVKLGAYFSLSPYFGHPRKEAQLATFAQVPVDRLLAESDAPDMWPPDNLNNHPLKAPDGSVINHPANVEISYRLLAQARAVDIETLTAQIAENYRRLFGVSSSA